MVKYIMFYYSYFVCLFPVKLLSMAVAAFVPGNQSMLMSSSHIAKKRGCYPARIMSELSASIVLKVSEIAL